MSLMRNQQYFASTKFVKSVFSLSQLPKITTSTIEIVILGRSNSGKSSIINALTNKKKLAMVSKTPGRTQAINYFQVDNDKYLVDLPGYGYAKIPTKLKLSWDQLLPAYLQTRSSLAAAIMIMDIRYPYKELDLQILNFCLQRNLPTHIVLNKADQLSQQQRTKTLNLSIAQIENHTNLISIQCASANKGMGITELSGKIQDWFTTLPNAIQ